MDTAAVATEVAARELSRMLAERQQELVRAWWRLGADGPTHGSPDAGTAGEAAERYLGPLARLLIGGLAGSRDHAAVYLDERLRYLDENLAPAERRAVLARAIQAETAAIARLVRDLIGPGATEQVLADFHAPLIRPADPKLRVLFIGDCLFVETRAFLVPEMERRGCPIETSHVFFSAAQRLDGVNTAVVNEVRRRHPDVIGISLFTFEGIPLYRAAWRSAATGLARSRDEDLVDGLVGALQQLIEDIRSVTGATIVLHAPGGLPLDPLRRRLPMIAPHSRQQRRLVATLGRRVAELADNSVNVVTLDEAAVIDRAGGLRAMAQPLFAADDVPPGYAHTSRLGTGIAAGYASVLADYELLGAAKVLLVDFDNTLWDGVMGEGPVDHHRDRQRLLLELRASGVVLVAVSKNDPNLIRWDEMVLAESDFAVTKINWNPKADSVAAAVAELDLAPETFVLIDDNPVERALVVENVPGVRALDATDERSWLTLRNWLRFPSTAQTDEARRRTEMYREAAARRRALSAVTDYATMMTSLNLRHTVRIAQPRDVDRILELVQRTNQFNTTTRRRSLAEVQGLIDDDTTAVYVASLADRFGDLGVVAVAIFDRRAREFDSVIMSCRAMGFGLELALLRSVMDREGAPPFHGSFAATERNGPAADLFERAGFVEAEPGRWELRPGMALPERPAWLN